MSGFILAADSHGASAPHVAKRLAAPLDAMRRKPIRLSGTVDAGKAVLFLFANDHHDPAAVMARGARDDFVTYVGTMFYRGRTGAAAARLLQDDLTARGDCVLDDPLGNYCLIVRQGHTVRLLTDPAGLYHLYTTEDDALVSSSFIAAAVSCGDNPELGGQEICEYIFNGATFGEQTLVRRVRRAAADEELRLVAGQPVRARRSSPWTDSRERFGVLSVPEHLDWAEDQARPPQQAAAIPLLPSTELCAVALRNRNARGRSLRQGRPAERPAVAKQGSDSRADAARRVVEHSSPNHAPAHHALDCLRTYS